LIFYIISLANVKLQGYVLSVLSGTILAQVLALSIPRTFSEDDHNLGISSGLKLKQKFNIFAMGTVSVMIIHLLENLIGLLFN
jgi:hypothetical protein